MTFGSRVLGEKEYNRQKALREEKRKKGSGLGKRVTDKVITAATPAPEPVEETLDEAERAEATGGEPEPAPPETAAEGASAPAEPTKAPTLSLKELGKALKSNTSSAAFDALLEAELNRPEGEPRKNALLLFQAAEKAREEGPRKAVLAEVARLIKNAGK